MSLLGIDLGTSGIRVGAYTRDGRLLASEARPLRLRRPAPGRVELDAVEIQDAVESAIRAITAGQHLTSDAVEAISFSVLGEAVVPVDAAGSPLAPVIVSMDERGADVAKRLEQAISGAEYHSITGQPLHPMFAAFKIAAESGPWQAAARFQCMGDFLTSQWTGEAVIDFGMAARMGVLDVERRTWSGEILDRLNAPWLNESTLPRLGASGDPVGEVLPAVAARLGLPEGVIVALGTHDQAAAFLGSGGEAGRRCCISLGSSDCFTVATLERPLGFDDTGFASYPIDQSTWITLAGTAAGGWALEWFSALAGGKPVSEVFGELALEPPPLLVVPYLRGSGTLDNDPTATGTVHGLTLETTTPQLARAFVEASGFEFAKIADALEAHAVTPGDAVVCGSGARNSHALLARANAFGRGLRATAENASSRGAALLAARSIGAEDEFRPSLKANTTGPTMPEAQRVEWYEAQRGRYVALCEATRNLPAYPPQTPTH